jgi:hypothetical protein
MTAIRGLNRPAPELEAIRRTHHATGMTFLAILMRGKVVDLRDEQYPDGWMKHAKDGGLVPDGLAILQKDGRPTPQHKQWAWQQLRHPTFDSIVGKDKATLLRLTDEPAPVAA